MRKEEAIATALDHEITLLVLMLVKLTLICGIPKHRLTEIVSDAYDIERDNRRSPQ